MFCYTTLAVCLRFGNAESIGVEEFETYVEAVQAKSAISLLEKYVPEYHDVSESAETKKGPDVRLDLSEMQDFQDIAQARYNKIVGLQKYKCE